MLPQSRLVLFYQHEPFSPALGTVIAVQAGEVVPADGVVVEGKCEVDEKALTGESFVVAKEIGSSVWAGTINLNGLFLVWYTLCTVIILPKSLIQKTLYHLLT